MTDLAERQVKPTFSKVPRYSTGLSRAEPHEAGGEDVGDLIETLLIWKHEPSPWRWFRN
jgi:hypothetical protein